MTKTFQNLLGSSIKLGIVGSEAAKFDWHSEKLARTEIRNLIRKHQADIVISGGCHLGGIDQWAVEEAKKLNVGFIEYLPNQHTWGGGYKERNLKIARNSDVVYCITVKELPPEYKGMRFKLCYHCGTTDHVKSGGCWTVKEAKKLGKETGIIVI